MSAGIWVFFMSTGLRIVAGSPDALCPTLAEAETVIHSRVGEVVGGSYTATYTIVRDPDRERELVRMVLAEDEGEVVLEREIQIGPGGCSEAAQAMALILERYFQSLEAPADAEHVALTPAEPTESVETRAPAVSTAEAPSNERDAGSPHGSAATAPASQTNEREHTLGALRAGLGMRETGTGIGQIGVELRSDEALALSLDGVLSLGEEKTTELDYELASQQFGLELAASWLVPLGRHFELGMGPLVGARLEVARLEDDAVATGSQHRIVPHVGLQGLARYELGRVLQLDLTARAARALTGPATEFEIETVDGESVEVLVPRAWLGEAVLSLGARF
jgi:hypothetical protein